MATAPSHSLHGTVRPRMQIAVLEEREISTDPARPIALPSNAFGSASIFDTASCRVVFERHAATVQTVCRWFARGALQELVTPQSFQHTRSR